MKNYLEDALSQLIADSVELKLHDSSEFDKGKIMGYYEIISKLLNQAEAYGYLDSLSDDIRNFNPESLL